MNKQIIFYSALLLVWALSLFLAYGRGIDNGIKSAADTARENASIGADGSERDDRGERLRPKSAGGELVGGPGGESFLRGPGDEGRPVSLAEFRDQLPRLMTGGHMMMRGMRIFDLAMKLDPADVPAAMKILDSDMRGPMKEQVRHMLLHRWAQSDPHSAIAYLETEADARTRAMGITGVYSGWASVDPRGAMEYVKNNPDQSTMMGQQDQRLNAVIMGAMMQSPEEGLALLDAIEDQVQKQQAAQQVMFQMLYGGMEDDLKAWVARQPEDATRSQLVMQAASQLARFEPLETLDWLETMTTTEDDRNLARQNVLSTWAHSDPQKVLEYVLSDAGTEREMGIVMPSAVSSWYQQDPQAVADFLNSAEPSPALDSGIRTFAALAMREDPESAMAWVDVIGSEGDRNLMRQQVGWQWKQQDPEGFEAYAAETGLVLDENVPQPPQHYSGNLGAPVDMRTQMRSQAQVAISHGNLEEVDLQELRELIDKKLEGDEGSQEIHEAPAATEAVESQ